MKIERIPSHEYDYAIRVDLRDRGGDVYERPYYDTWPVHEAILDLVDIALGTHADQQAGHTCLDPMNDYVGFHPPCAACEREMANG